MPVEVVRRLQARREGEAVKREGLIHRLPLTGFDVEVRLPRDLSVREAERIRVWIATLAQEWASREEGKAKP